MWLDNIYRCQEPAETAACLLDTTGEAMQLTSGVDLHRLVNLVDRVVDMMLDVEAVDAAQKPAEGVQWELLFGGASLYEPSVAAGLFGLSSALSAAVRDGSLDAGVMYSAMHSIDRLPDRFAPDEASSTSMAARFRQYAFVPTVDAVRRVWVAFAFSREANQVSADGALARRFFQRAWSDFVDLGYEPIDRASAVRGLILAQLAGMIEPSSPAPRSLDLADLPGLAAQQKWTLEEHGGPSRVAMIFQERVMTVMKSFNCRVVGAKPGDALGDIYVELPDGDFVLVDAKSTGAEAGYTFPKGDQDAIARYLGDAARVLPSGRRFRAVLIVGPDPGRTLPRRLADFQAVAGCDIRYSTASQLVQFREAFPGGSLVGLERALHEGSHVLPEQWWRPLVTASDAENRRLADYLRKGLDG
jgi:hypothetical protein